MVGDPFNVTQNNPDFYRNLMNWGFATMSAGAKPGATTLGSLGEGGMAASESARQNALARAQSEYYGQNTLNKQLENQAALYDMNLDRRALGQPTIGDDLTPMMDTASPSMSRTPSVGMLPTQPGTESRPAASSGALSEDALLRIARGNVTPRSVGEAESALVYAKKGSAKEKYLQDYIEANRFTGEKAKATLPYDLQKTNASANAGAQGQIQRLMKTGLSENDAIAIVDGSSKVVVDPVSGSPFLVNLATGTSKTLESPIANEPLPAPQAGGIPEKRTSLYELAGDSTGPVSEASSYYAALTAFDPTGLMPIPEDTVKAREQINIESNQLVRQLQTSPRFVEGERKAIEKEITLEPKILQSPQLLRARMEAIDLSLTDKLNQAEREARDTSLPVDARRAAKRDASSIKNFLKKLDVPKSGSPMSQSNKVTGKSLSEIWGD